MSGGLDSSAIAAVAARYRRGDLHAISVGYPLTERKSGASDERDFARELAALLRIPFHDIEIDRDEIVSAFPHHVVAIDDPVVDIASYGYASVARKAQELDIPVLLFGMGGDELFAGYAWMAKAYRSIARELRWKNGRATPGEFSRNGSCQPARSKYFESWDIWSSRPGQIAVLAVLAGFSACGRASAGHAYPHHSASGWLPRIRTSILQTSEASLIRA